MMKPFSISNFNSYKATSLVALQIKIRKYDTKERKETPKSISGNV